MKNLVIALMLISALLLSSISLALSLTSRSMPEAQEHSSIPFEAFEGLGSKKGVGFGDWTVKSENPNLTIFSYPAGSVLNWELTTYEHWDYNTTIPGHPVLYLKDVYYFNKSVCPGWDGYLVDMLMTITVTMDSPSVSPRPVNVTFYYLDWFWNSTYLEEPDKWFEFYDRTKASTTLTIGIGSGSPQSATFTGQIYLVTLTLVGTEGSAGGHYFVSADRRV